MADPIPSSIFRHREWAVSCLEGTQFQWPGGWQQQQFQLISHGNGGMPNHTMDRFHSLLHGFPASLPLKCRNVCRKTGQGTADGTTRQAITAWRKWNGKKVARANANPANPNDSIFGPMGPWHRQFRGFGQSTQIPRSSSTNSCAAPSFLDAPICIAMPE